MASKHKVFKNFINNLDDSGLDDFIAKAKGHNGRRINYNKGSSYKTTDALSYAQNIKGQRIGNSGGGSTSPASPSGGGSSSPKTPTGSQRSYVNNVGSAVGEGLGWMGTAKAVGSYGAANFRRNVGGDWGDQLKWAGGRALRGAVAGGAVGGTAEAAQGGSFWTGAKEGAFNGAVGWTAYRAAGQAFGGGSRNPANVFGGFGNAFGLVSSDAAKMTRAAQNASVAQRAQMSKSVKAIIQNKADGSKGVM